MNVSINGTVWTCTCHNTWPCQNSGNTGTLNPASGAGFGATYQVNGPVSFPVRLSDDDVERIAKRVVELLKETK